MSADVSLVAEEEYHDPSESDQYHIIELIGSGATGTVYKAKDVKDKGKLVAIKQLRYDNSEGTPHFVMREISDLKRLSGSPHIVSLLDVFSEPAKSLLCRSSNEITLNLVFEYVAQDLAQHIEASVSSTTVFSEAYIKDLMEQLLKGVEAIHNNNIIHRDLKPSNILISPDSKLKISDFGLSRPFHTGKILSTQVVTICYRAPELLLSSGSYSFAVDMWSVGCIFAEMYLKCPLFQATNEINMLKKIFGVIGTPSLEEWPTSVHIDLNSFEKLKPKELTELLPGASPETCNLISKLLRFKDSQRLSVDDALKDKYFEQTGADSQDSGIVV